MGKLIILQIIAICLFVRAKFRLVSFVSYHQRRRLLLFDVVDVDTMTDAG